MPNSRFSTPRFAPYRCIKNCTRNNEKKVSENYLVSIPTSSSPSVGSVGIVAIDYNIYKIGGLINGVPSSRVFVMDYRSHTWHEAPSMQIARKLPSVSVLDGKIYVVEGCENLDLSNKVECFDLKTQVWENVLSPDAEICRRFKEKRIKCLRGYCCAIDNVLYCYDEWLKRFEWYDSEAGIWRDLKGLEKVPKLPKPFGNSSYVRMANYGGKIAILWEKDEFMEKKIWCAEISHGKIEWCGAVLTVPRSCYILHSLTVTV